MRLLLELTALTRATIPSTMPLFVRIPGSDWMPSSSDAWDVDQCVTLSLALSDLGVDFIDVSSAGLMSEQQVKSGPGYQVPFSAAVKKALQEHGKDKVTKVGIVGMVTSSVQAEKLLEEESGDAVLVARAFQRNPGLVWEWAEELGVEVRVANQIGWGFGQKQGGGVKSVNAAAARG
jgi:2,4-dienoyl-CoA reductase-like NADH-dependent reductase (Old Yellow Enzyme family)